MTVLQSLLFGALQGATEFLPVSSSGHLALMKSFFDLSEVPLLFDVLLHVATLLVVIGVFRRRIGAILAGLYRIAVRRRAEGDGEQARIALAIVVATVVTGVLGLLVGRLEIGGNVRIVSILFIVTGGILIGSRFLGGDRTYREIGWKDGLIVGLGQGIGVLPGISRSGISIAAGLASGLDRERAGEFAFLVSVPAVVGALVLTLRDSGELSSVVSTGSLVIAFLAALVVGIASLLVLLRLVRRGRLYLFSLYLVPLGIAGLIFG